MTLVHRKSPKLSIVWDNIKIPLSLRRGRKLGRERAEGRWIVRVRSEGGRRNVLQSEAWLKATAQSASHHHKAIMSHICKANIKMTWKRICLTSLYWHLIQRGPVRESSLKQKSMSNSWFGAVWKCFIFWDLSSDLIRYVGSKDALLCLVVVLYIDYNSWHGLEICDLRVQSSHGQFKTSMTLTNLDYKLCLHCLHFSDCCLVCLTRVWV